MVSEKVRQTKNLLHDAENNTVVVILRTVNTLLGRQINPEEAANVFKRGERS